MRLEISGPGNFFSPALSPDSSALYFQAVNAWGGYGKNDFWQVTFTPVVDFDADGAVNAVDMLIMADNWHTHHALCDIAPLPVGDGYVDVKDLIALAEHLEPGDPTLVAHWKLDETDGDTACDGASAYDGILCGRPVWEPAGGYVGGALRCDGVDDYISIPFVLNPGEGPFSVFAWIQGGAPGEVVLSQATGRDWLVADSVCGWVMTNLSFPPGGRVNPYPLVSQRVITDGVWHRIGFTWDGVNRRLYVDDVLVAEDAQSSLVSCSGSLYIGTGKGLEPGTFFSGLIDDVRIYDRAVKP